MDFEHIVIHKDMEWHSAFPEIIRLKNGDMVCVFRQAPVRPGTGVHGEQGASVTHFHQDANSRSVMVRSLDDGLTWDPSTRVIVSESDGTQDHNLAMVSQVSSGELIANNLRLFAYLDDEGKAKLAGTREITRDRPARPFDSMAYDSLYMMRSSDNGHTWSEPARFGIPTMEYWTHTGQTGVVELPDGTWLLPFHGHGPGDIPSEGSYDGGERTGDAFDRVFVARSYDQGKTWGSPSVVMHDPNGVISFHEPPLLRLSSGRLLIVTRTAGPTTTSTRPTRTTTAGRGRGCRARRSSACRATCWSWRTATSSAHTATGGRPSGSRHASRTTAARRGTWTTRW